MTPAIDLTLNEVMVLAQCLDELVRRGDFPQIVRNKADRQALNNLLSALEPLDSEAFSEHYSARLEEARAAILGESQPRPSIEGHQPVPERRRVR